MRWSLLSIVKLNFCFSPSSHQVTETSSHLILCFLSALQGLSRVSSSLAVSILLLLGEGPSGSPWPPAAISSLGLRTPFEEQSSASVEHSPLWRTQLTSVGVGRPRGTPYLPPARLWAGSGSLRPWLPLHLFCSCLSVAFEILKSWL